MTPASLFARKDLSRGLVTTFIILSTAGGGGGGGHVAWIVPHDGSLLQVGWPDRPTAVGALVAEVTSTDERSRSPRRTR